MNALYQGDLANNVTVRAGDILRVLPAPRVIVRGYVEEPGEFTLRGKTTTALGALAMAGGLKIPEASPDMAQIRRATPVGWVVIPLDLVAIADGEQDDPRLCSGDILEIRQSTLRWVGLGVYGFVRGVFSLGFNAASLF